MTGAWMAVLPPEPADPEEKEVDEEEEEDGGGGKGEEEEGGGFEGGPPYPEAEMWGERVAALP